MILTEEEIEQAVARLRRSTKMPIDRVEEAALRRIVVGLAEALDVPRSPESIRVFMLWMGNDD